MTEREKMLAGGWFDPRDAELTAIRDNATRLMLRLNVELCGHDDAYRAALRELCPGCEGFIREPFRCDYGLNISIGEGSFVNFDCVFLDLAPIRIGRQNPQYYEVLEGLQPGERVIVSGYESYGANDVLLLNRRIK